MWPHISGKRTWGYDNSRKTSSQQLKAAIEKTKGYELQLESIGNKTEISVLLYNLEAHHCLK